MTKAASEEERSEVVGVVKAGVIVRAAGDMDASSLTLETVDEVFGKGEKVLVSSWVTLILNVSVDAGVVETLIDIIVLVKGVWTLAEAVTVMVSSEVCTTVVVTGGREVGDVVEEPPSTATTEYAIRLWIRDSLEMPGGLSGKL